MWMSYACDLESCHHLRGGVDWNRYLRWPTEKGRVTTFAVVWIEIRLNISFNVFTFSHHLRGGVDWNTQLGKKFQTQVGSPPSRWCGLKYNLSGIAGYLWMSSPSQWCRLKLDKDCVYRVLSKSSPSRWCGLKSRTTWNTVIKISPHLRSGVNWNKTCRRCRIVIRVITFTVVWIEMQCNTLTLFCVCQVLPSQ